MEEVHMKVGRITSLEFKSENGVDTFVDLHKKNCSELGAEVHCITQTGTSSAIVLSIYSDEETALALQDVRENYKNNTKHLFSDYFFYEGQIKLLVDGDGEDLLDVDSPKIEWRAEASELRKQIKAQSAQLDELKEMLSEVLAKLPS
jgi:hypothetical protein